MKERTSPVKATETVPEFVLKDHDNKEFDLSSRKGKRVLLSLHPLAWTSICAKQMQALEANEDTFASLNTVPVGLSIDSVPCKQAWAEHLGIKSLRLLSDFWPHGHVARLYGLFREKEGFSERANVILDEKGKVSFVKVYPLSQLPDIEEIIAVLKGR
ncbi:MAG: redoxin domain-containing protein [Chloroflexi bacterium]|nr:redoxin domain-containing protein [Chloroflexota bacterium]